MPAFADDCSNINSNPQWTLNVQMLRQDIQYENYDAALEKAAALSAICADSPTLNYAISMIYNKKGDKAQEREYLERATANLNRFDVDPEVQRQMWTDLIFVDHPDARPENVEQLRSELDSANLELRDLRASSLKANPESGLAVQVGLWSSVGVAGAGVIFTMIGGIIVAAMDSPIQLDEKSRTKATIETKYAAAWGLFGAGIAMMVAGSAGTGYFAYRYVKLSESDSISFNVSPTSIGITGTF